MLMRALFVHIAHEIAGAARIRHSLRPLNLERAELLANLGRIASRERRHISSVVTRHRVGRMGRPMTGSGGGPSIPEAPTIEPRNRGVLDHPPSRVTTAFCDATPSTSLRAQRSNPFFLCAATWIASLRSP